MVMRWIQNIAPQAVEDSAGPHHVSPGRGLVKNAGRICQVFMLRRKTVFAKDICGRFKSLHLTIRQRLASVIVSSSEVRHQTIKANVLKTLQSLSKFRGLIESHTE